MIKIGLTGGIGSGKTTVAKVFERFGGGVYTSDLRAKIIQNENPKAVFEIKKLFGEDIYSDGVLNRKYLADIVFNDSEKLKQLNGIVHPLVFEDFSKFLDENQDKRFVVLESAILIESGFYKFADFSVLVTSDLSLRLKRVMARDKISEEKVFQRIKNQLSDQELKINCEYEVINNDIQTLESQVKDILRQNNLLF
ncbi:MAG: dephospho-CoA kinase [Bacteroidales bacterium]|nr:dephospho-CoA kinase [Bacteroidales bacterium]